MLHLDAGRTPPADQGAARGGLGGALTGTADWPVAWSVLVLFLSAVGGHWPLAAAPGTSLVLIRLAAVVPLLLVMAPAGLRPALWLACAALAATGGAAAVGDLDARPVATAADVHVPSDWVRHDGAAVLRLTARPRPAADGGWTAPARLLAWRPAEARAPDAPWPGAGLLVRGDGDVPCLGEVLGGAWRLSPPRRAPVPGGFDEAAWLRGRSLDWTATPLAADDGPRARSSAGPIAGLGRAQSGAQDALRRRLAGGLPPREATLAGAVLLGGGMQRDLREPFAKLGLAHLFALSGLHVGIVSGLFLLVIGRFVRGPGWRLPAMGLALVAYAALVDVPDSVVRAVGLVVLALALRAAGRPLDGLRLLGLLLWLNVLWRPDGLLDVGLRLSYLAAGGIVCGQRAIAGDLADCPAWCRAPLRGLTVSLAAQTATVPVLAASFGVLPLVGPLVNVLAVPVFGVAALLLGGGLLLAVVWPWAGEGLLACAWLVLRPLQAATVAAGSPLAALEVGLPVWGAGRLLAYAAGLGLLLFVLRRSRRRTRLLAVPLHASLLVIAVLWPAGPPLGGRAQAWQLAVGQGDCALVRLPDGWTCLIDAGPGRPGGGGPYARDVAPFLRRLNLRRLDAVILTHGHADHTAGADDLARALAVERWYVAGRAAPPDTSLDARRPVAGDTLHAAAGWSLVCVHPPAPDWAARNENDHSLSVALCRDGQVHGLWTGDLEADGERAMLRALPPAAPPSRTAWKTGHHGSRTSGTADLLASLAPGVVVTSCGVANRHRHPSHGPYGDMVHLRTDLHGTVHLSWNRRGDLRWRALRPWPP